MPSQRLEVGPAIAQAVALQALARYEDALRCFDEAAALGSRDGSLYWNRALVQTALGRDLPALKDFEQASSRLGLQNGLQAEWLAAAERILATAPANRDALFARALVLVVQKAMARGDDRLRDTARSRPQRP